MFQSQRLKSWFVRSCWSDVNKSRSGPQQLSSTHAPHARLCLRMGPRGSAGTVEAPGTERPTPSVLMEIEEDPDWRQRIAGRGNPQPRATGDEWRTMQGERQEKPERQRPTDSQRPAGSAAISAIEPHTDHRLWRAPDDQRTAAQAEQRSTA